MLPENCLVADLVLLIHDLTYSDLCGWLKVELRKALPQPLHTLPGINRYGT